MWMGNAQTAPTAHQRQWSVAPIVGFTPETRWQFGATTTMLYKPNPLDSLSRTSNANALAIFSTSGQLLFHVNHSTFLKAERYFLRGAADYMYFPWLYYGIGDATRAENEEAFNFKRVTFQQIAFLQLTKQFFVGAGYRYAQMFDMQIAPEGLLATEQITGYRGARSSGGILALLWDTRNNILNSRKGILIELQAAQYARNLGSTNAYAIFTADLRKYFTLAPHRGDVLAFQAYAYVGTPQTPFMDLAALGGSNIMRGYYQGRYRDLTQAAAQAEYRFPILAWLGGVAFVAGGNVSPDWQSFDWSRIKTAAGLGLRFKVIPGEDVNLRFDYAFGPGVRNFYFGFAEAF
jgi:outer membrane protein assembly factor BamA